MRSQQKIRDANYTNGQTSECESKSDFDFDCEFDSEFEFEFEAESATELVVNCQNGLASALGQFSSLTGRQRCGSRGGERSGLSWIMAESEPKQKRNG